MGGLIPRAQFRERYLNENAMKTYVKDWSSSDLLDPERNRLAEILGFSSLKSLIEDWKAWDLEIDWIVEELFERTRID